ncbi:MAG TPA: hypothetical protein VLQ80_18775, partial [Candidatus Saccharimonadia bacterium]|nr:hypothetical protein [Candidatus Saccharimonadia bacterium]
DQVWQYQSRRVYATGQGEVNCIIETRGRVWEDAAAKDTAPLTEPTYEALAQRGHGHLSDDRF